MFVINVVLLSLVIFLPAAAALLVAFLPKRREALIKQVSLAATLGPYAAYGLEKPAALNGPQFLTADVLKKPLRIEKGVAYAPTGPGLVIEVDEAKVKELMKDSGGDRLLKSRA